MLTRIEAPAEWPISLEEVKAFLRVDHDDDDTDITRFVGTAIANLDGRDGILSRCLVTQTWRMTVDRFYREIELPLPPCQSVSEIIYLDPSGVEQTLSPSDYRVYGIGGDDYARIRAATAWPSTQCVPDAISIEFVAGYPMSDGSPAVSQVPSPILDAMLQHVALLYENREAAQAGDELKRLPLGYDDLIRPYRIRCF